MKVKFLEPEIENGYLKIRWEKFNRPFFHSYEIVVNDSSLNNSYTRTILYPSVDYLIDSSFVGGSVTFTMYISVMDCAGHPTKSGKPVLLQPGLSLQADGRFLKCL